MNWKQLLTNKRLGQEHRHNERHDDRTEFKRDYDRLIFSAPFRRLQNKTQVFPLPGSIFVHNRLTHSLEVASVGMSLGNDVARQILAKNNDFIDTMLPEIGTIVSTACLAHDMGNPPFGHSGEKAIQAFFTEGKGAHLQERVSPETWADITHFEGNANAFRLLAHRYKGRREGGFVMTYTTLASIVKYPISSTFAGKKGKFGFFKEELPIYRKIASELGIPQLQVNNGTATGGSMTVEGAAYARHPLVYLVEAADDICYEVMDIEDAHKLKILSFEETSELLLGFFDSNTQARIRQRIIDEGITDDNEKVVYMRARVIGLLEKCCVDAFMANEKEIMEGSFKGSLIDEIAKKQRLAYGKCTETSRSRIYNSKPVLDVELSGFKIMDTLMGAFIEAVTYPDRFYSRQLTGRVGSQYDINSLDLETRIMAVIDYISGMTDVYALEIYQKINGISLPIV
ncbi:MAG: dNTP triphosphohydrolase [Prevotella sp.]|uniref:dGTP triphosphohydrolase n=1 Tax=Prevotella sp. TaxID=59823 RepID=UPI002A2C5AAF|nr:dNTP triphosphohydrolase [Prevotella sp.]MDD7318554.1 dNTP triphosphohydrolase [Prevotellaceae bacterium]MDY4020355.1 dNTP triphosphohydrolase [Prevotella sp.]